jgi:oxygen-independent coproporphyrinogen III oxidase
VSTAARAAVPPGWMETIARYDRPGPRYTSYPTAVEFDERFGADTYMEHLARAAANPASPLSLYVHLPFCEERCTFCGCTVIITRKREIAARYVDYLHRELALVADALGGRRTVVQYHWGGGTPTYLSLDEMRALHEAVTTHFMIRPDAEVAIEVDPRVTSLEQLRLLRAMGFNRLSMGVQDFTPEVQSAVNRIQTEAVTHGLFDEARRLGFESINVDLIYGLPRQTPESFGSAVDAVVAMGPDRVAVYSYAHVPWIRPHQRRIPPETLPTGPAKLELFFEAMDRFLRAGYAQIGMDHFARPGDEIARATASGTLHRNFMGYTTRPAADLIGIGVSAIGDVADAFAQNLKKLPAYYAALDAGRFPVERGYALDADDRIRRYVIAQIMCNFGVDYRDVERRFGVRFDEYFAQEQSELATGPRVDGLIELRGDRLVVTPLGRLLVRNVAMVFDRHLRQRHAEQPVFSRTV